MLKPLTDAERDYAFSIAFIEEWLKDAPIQVKEHLAVVGSAISGYREKYISSQEEYTKLNDLYNRLAGLSAQYLQTINQQKEQIDSMLIEDQIQFHKNKDFIET